MRHESWQVWRRLDEMESLSAVHRRKTIEDLATASAGVEERARSVFSEPPPPPSGEELSSRPVNLEPAQRKSFRPVSVDPVGVLSNAGELQDALLAHGVDGRGRGRGRRRARAPRAGRLERGRDRRWPRPRHRDAAGRAAMRVKIRRWSRRAAVAPCCPSRSPATSARYMIGRIERCLPEPASVAMVPLLLYGELVAIFEIGRRSRPLRAHEVARIENVVEALAERTVVMGWLD